MNIMSNRNRTATAAEDSLRERFESVASVLPGANVGWVRQMRQDAMQRFNALGLPHRRVEAWKYSDLRSKMRQVEDMRINGDDLSEAEIYEALGIDFDEMLSYRIVVADGAFKPELSNLEGAEGKLEVASLRETLDNPPKWFEEKFNQVNPQEDEAVIHLNTAPSRSMKPWVSISMKC